MRGIAVSLVIMLTFAVPASADAIDELPMEDVGASVLDLVPIVKFGESMAEDNEECSWLRVSSTTPPYVAFYPECL